VEVEEKAEAGILAWVAEAGLAATSGVGMLLVLPLPGAALWLLLLRLPWLPSPLNDASDRSAAFDEAAGGTLPPPADVDRTATSAN
jgi:hypothetical protein